MPGKSEAAVELGRFLRSRREQLQPVDVGLDWGRRRRAVGLRRSEVAQLAGLSETRYTWLEQGRAALPVQVLASVAKALRLNDDEARYVTSFSQAPAPDTTLRAPDDRAVAPELSTLLQKLEPNPAYVIDRNWDFLAWNRAFAGLTLDLFQVPSQERNLLWLMFCWPPYRRMLLDWEPEARKLLGQYRATLHLKRHDERLDHIAAMLRESPEARDWWDEHLIAGYRSAVMSFKHPTAGPLRFEYVKLDAVENPGQHVVIYMADTFQTHQKLQGLSRRQPLPG